MISPASWWWPSRPPRVPETQTAGLLAGLGVVLFTVSAVLARAGPASWDARLFRILNEVPAAAASVLTPLSHLFLPAGIIAVVLVTVVYAVARNRSVLPVAAAALAAGAAWMLANLAKAITDRPRPYQVVADTVLRQPPAHGPSFPSSHTAVTLAVAIALVPFLARLLAAAGITYAILVGWSRVYLGAHYPLDVLAGAGAGMAVGGVVLLALGMLLRRAGRSADDHNAAVNGGVDPRLPGRGPGRAPAHPADPRGPAPMSGDEEIFENILALVMAGVLHGHRGRASAPAMPRPVLPGRGSPGPERPHGHESPGWAAPFSWE